MLAARDNAVKRMLRKCLYCEAEGDGNFSSSYLPGTLHFGKTYTPICCGNCGLTQIDPALTPVDLLALYPPSYQGHGVNCAPAPLRQRRAPFGAHFSYARHFDLIQLYAPAGPVLDFGCGDGNFVANAALRGLACDGVEYDLAQVELLRKAMPGSEFFAYDEFAAQKPQGKYAAIRLSNVLEHLTAPREQLGMLSRYLAPGGVLLIEGPLEENANLAFFARKLHFTVKNLLKPGWKASHPPFHVSFASASTQRRLFFSLGFESHYFHVGEGEWPFPVSLSTARGVGLTLKFFLARLSMAISAIVPSWGNAFLCVEKPRT
jgi:SAM-dependent methyltransferase